MQYYIVILHFYYQLFRIIRVLRRHPCVRGIKTLVGEVQTVCSSKFGGCKFKFLIIHSRGI